MPPRITKFLISLYPTVKIYISVRPNPVWSPGSNPWSGSELIIQDLLLTRPEWFWQDLIRIHSTDLTIKNHENLKQNAQNLFWRERSKQDTIIQGVIRLDVLRGHVRSGTLTWSVWRRVSWAASSWFWWSPFLSSSSASVSCLFPADSWLSSSSS